jgi:hypothetical protein
LEDDSSSSLDSAPLKTRRLLANGAAVSGHSRSVISKVAAPDAAVARKKQAVKTGPAARGGGGGHGGQGARGGGGSDSSNSGGTSPEELSRRQSMSLASKFRRFYAQYEQLYKDINSAVEPPSKARKDELLKMHYRLSEMKKMLVGAALGS